ncbi:hypothetical protein ACHAPJ_011172 [Fusarium lateritium]
MIFPNFVAGVIAALSVRAVNAGPCRPSSQTTAVTVSDTTTAETSFATSSTLLTTSGLDVTTDLTSFITLTAETTTSDLASTSSAFVPADLFPCSTASDCDAFVELCDTVRCGCINRQCERLTDTTTTVAEATTTAETTTTAIAVEETTTTTAAETAATTSALSAYHCNIDSDCETDVNGLSCAQFGCECVDSYCQLQVN